MPARYAAAAHEPAVVVFYEAIGNGNRPIFRELVDEGPMTGAALTVENPGCGKHERSIANRRDMFGALCETPDLRLILRAHRRCQIGAARDQNEVGFLDIGQPLGVAIDNPELKGHVASIEARVANVRIR
jgi:hypothetical protein